MQEDAVPANDDPSEQLVGLGGFMLPTFCKRDQACWLPPLCVPVHCFCFGVRVLSMTSIRVKNVSSDVHQILRQRAVGAGQSLQEYLLHLLCEQARHPTPFFVASNCRLL